MDTTRVVLRSILPIAIAIVAFGIAQEFLSPSQTVILIVALVNVILAVSLNVVNGFTGQFSLGHAGFMAIGAYTAAKFTTAFRGAELFGLSADTTIQLVFLVALIVGMILAGVMGFVVGMPSLRLRGDYLAIVTLGFNEIIRVIIENTKFLGEATGISGLPRLTSVLWAGVAAVATIAMARRLVGSSHGRALLAIREDEIAAEAMGVDTTGYKVRAFVISAAFAGLAGGLLVHLIQLCTPRSFTFIKSIEVVAMVVLGGMGSVTGSVVAALTLTFALEALRGVAQYRMVMYALLLIVLMLTRPEGLFGTREIWDLLPRLFKKRGGPPPGPVTVDTGTAGPSGSDRRVS